MMKYLNAWDIFANWQQYIFKKKFQIFLVENKKYYICMGEYKVHVYDNNNFKPYIIAFSDLMQFTLTEVLN